MLSWYSQNSLINGHPDSEARLTGERPSEEEIPGWSPSSARVVSYTSVIFPKVPIQMLREREQKYDRRPNTTLQQPIAVAIMCIMRKPQ